MFANGAYHLTLQHFSVHFINSLKLSNTFTVLRRWGRPFVACGGFVVLHIELLHLL